MLSVVRTFAKYLLFQVPSWGLALVLLGAAAHAFELPASIVGILVTAFVVKDLALYPRLRIAYEDGPSRFVGPDALVGAVGRVEERLEPRGHVRIGGERWRAVAVADTAPLEVGSLVRVRGVAGLELRVGSHDRRD